MLRTVLLAVLLAGIARAADAPKPTLLKPEEVVALARAVETHRAGPPA